MPEALVCPKCSATVQYRDAGSSLRCPHCQTPLLPSQSSPAGAMSQIPEEFRPLVEKALEVAKASGHSGPLNTIQAIKYYRQATGGSLADAKRAIDAAGPLHVGPAGVGAGQPAVGARQNRSFLGALVIAAVIAGLAGAIIAITQNRSRSSARQPVNSAPPPMPMPSVPSIQKALSPPAAEQFATMALEFGREGVGPGHFEDARSISVDDQGHVYVGEYSNGRVQVFDTSGKYLSEFSLGPNSYLQNLIAGRDGTVYAVSSSHIMRFTGSSGAALSEIERGGDGEPPRSYTDACLAPGGVIYAISNGFPGEPQIVKLDAASGKLASSFGTNKSVGESLDLFRIVALSTGEIYALDRAKGVFKFAADGRYINRFGGGKKVGASPLDLPPSQLFSPQNIAIDSHGRIYVSDPISCIKVYDRDGNYLDKFGGNEVVFGIAIDDQDNIYACLRNRHTVRKYLIAKR
jgi:DNA-binding beta-propeller fold protein YncE